ncbi:hypothetical protein R1sor_011682 [Riccia sorocarpa]|uniref:BHLH domain-containing protein n=1 Tax=Riccia sorocarpa TaxID=122646 RepID=A0ABD3I2X1_9MARC
MNEKRSGRDQKRGGITAHSEACAHDGAHLQADDPEVMQPLIFVRQDLPEAAAEVAAKTYQLQELQEETFDSDLNYLLLGFCRPEGPQNDYVGLGLSIQSGANPLTNTNEECGGTGDAPSDFQTHQLPNFDGRHLPADGVPTCYPDMQPHQVQEFDIHLPAGEVPLQILDWIDDIFSNPSNLQDLQPIQNQVQQKADFSPMDQQYDQHMFQQQPMHDQRMLPQRPTHGIHNLNGGIHELRVEIGGQYNTGLSDGANLTSCEERVKCIESFRQQREQQLLQQRKHQLIYQLPMHDHDRSFMDDLQSGTSNGGCDSPEFTLFDAHNEDLPRKDVNPNILYSGTYACALGLSTTAARPVHGLSAAGSSFCLLPAGSTVPVSSFHNPAAGANPLVDANSTSPLGYLNGITNQGKNTAGVPAGRDMQLRSTKRVKMSEVTDKQRRHHLNEQYQTLRSLLPNPTKPDRASIVTGAINRIQELKKEIEVLSKGAELGGVNTYQVLQGHKCDTGSTNRDLRATFIKKASEHGTEVILRITKNEVHVDITQKYTPRFLIRLLGALELNLKLPVLSSNGARIRNYNVYRLKTKITQETNTSITFMAGKLLEVVDAVF